MFNTGHFQPYSRESELRATREEKNKQKCCFSGNRTSTLSRSSGSFSHFNITGQHGAGKYMRLLFNSLFFTIFLMFLGLLQLLF